MPKSNPSTKEKILAAAQDLMLIRGFSAVSIDEICKTAAVSKGSFFHFFTSKEELGKAVLDYYFHSTQGRMSGHALEQIQDPLERIYGYLDFIIEVLEDPLVPKSCLFGNFAQELSLTHPDIRIACLSGFSQWADALQRDLDEAKRHYAPQAKVDTRSIAEYFISIYEGSLILVKAKQDVGVVKQNLEHFKRYLAQLFVNTQKQSD